MLALTEHYLFDFKGINFHYSHFNTKVLLVNNPAVELDLSGLQQQRHCIVEQGKDSPSV